MYAEDLDLGWRLAKAGWTTRYEPRRRRAPPRERREQGRVRRAGGRRGQVGQANNAWMVRRQGLARTWASSGIAATEAGLRVAALSVLARRDRDRFGEKLDVGAARPAAAPAPGSSRSPKLLEAR